MPEPYEGSVPDSHPFPIPNGNRVPDSRPVPVQYKIRFPIPSRSPVYMKISFPVPARSRRAGTGTHFPIFASRSRRTLYLPGSVDMLDPRVTLYLAIWHSILQNSRIRVNDFLFESSCKKKRSRTAVFIIQKSLTDRFSQIRTMACCDFCTFLTSFWITELQTNP